MPAPSRARKKFQPAHDVMFKKMIWMNVWYILIQRSFAMLTKESEEIIKNLKRKKSQLGYHGPNNL